MQIVLVGHALFEGGRGAAPPKTNGIAAHLTSLMDFYLSQNIQVKFVGRIYNYEPQKNLEYLECLKEQASTKEVILSLIKFSLFSRIEKDAIIHAHRPDTLFAAALFKRNPTIVTIHGQQADIIKRRKGRLERGLYNFMEKRALKKAKLIIVTDEITKQYYADLFPEHAAKTIVIPTGVNVHKFKPMPKKPLRIKFGLPEEAKVCLFLGRIETPTKRIDDTIDAFPLVLRRYPQAKLIVVGEGRDREKMEAKVRGLDLENTVFFWGNRAREEIPEILNIGDVLVLYSHIEGSPVIIREALACGIPVVANLVGDNVETVIDGKTGYLVRHENTEELARCINLCLENAASMQASCIEKAREYADEIIGGRTLEAYKTSIGIR